jgi:hypothetical protein
MKRLAAVSALAAALVLGATSAMAQTPGAAPPSSGASAPDVQIQTTPERKPEGAKVIAPPLHYEQTRPPESGTYRQDVRVEHDPAFIEPFTGSFENDTSSGQYGLSGWTSPNTPVGPSIIGYREINGYLGFGFSIVWGGPPARPVSLRPAPAR